MTCPAAPLPGSPELRTSGDTAWRDRYLAVGEIVGRGATLSGPVLTGQSACVDQLFTVDAERLARLAAAAADGGPDAELVGRVLDRVVAGRGGELVGRRPGAADRLRALLGAPDRRQVGGTGPQAAWALAVVGAPSVLALQDRSEQQLEVIDTRVGLCSGREVVPAGDVRPAGTPTKDPHLILECVPGVGAGPVSVRRATRIIVRFGNEPVECDDAFAAVSPTVSGVRAGLLSGLNGIAEHDAAAVRYLSELDRRWRGSGLAVVHHELAEYRSPAHLAAAVDLRLGTSLGLSLSELTALAGSGAVAPRARDVAVRAGVDRVVVHADDWVLAVHRAGAQPPVLALLAGSLLAAGRAAAGRPTAELAPPPAATYADDRPSDGRVDREWCAVAVPAPYLHRPSATVGLGDTFVAGLLLADSLP
ncbi:ADP-dependent glucokinase/phosphofructokinase [Nakamurella endophytica]|uniref:ADP-dependent phosphofructokinase/glucokinase n=1 Tax=Nakamurella endophytica TaxID=1748367 RepID=A0A917TDI0_9ACTN|nr:ADP-dependent glucokinase/phosphofructokinase [Nakamurella endophytica]GGM16623.1 hypothetical protein GCM10011594_40900 [Nakamurella endophytica]